MRNVDEAVSALLELHHGGAKRFDEEPFPIASMVKTTEISPKEFKCYLAQIRVSARDESEVELIEMFCMDLVFENGTVYPIKRTEVSREEV